jgi:hypothetical protein
MPSLPRSTTLLRCALEAPRRFALPWAELLKRTFLTHVLACPRCGGTRRVVAVVLRSSTAQAILEHVRLPSRPLPLARGWREPRPAKVAGSNPVFRSKTTGPGSAAARAPPF